MASKVPTPKGKRLSRSKRIHTRRVKQEAAKTTVVQN